MTCESDPFTDLSPARPEELIAHYERTLSRHGPTPEGMDWKDRASQELRFDVLCGLCELAGRSIHDVGAGAGHLHDYLHAKATGADYSGSDLSEKMIEAARRRHPEVSFEIRDAQAVRNHGPYDVVVCSGLLYVKLDCAEQTWKQFVHDTIRGMYDACRVGIAFNLMSDRVDYRNERLYYSSPEKMLRFCLSEFGSRVVLRHDYPLHEYTVYVYREETL